MSVLTCEGCGQVTNTTTCDYLEHKNYKPRKCFVRWVGNKPEKGCGFDSLVETEPYGKWYKKWCFDIIKKG